MRILLLTLLLFLPTLPATLAAADEPSPRPASTPKLRFSENEVPYGTLLQGEVAEKELSIHNDGDAPLLISQAIPSCGCTTVVEFPREIAAGAAGKVRFQIDSKKIRPGDTRKRIKFETNDPLDPHAAFFFAAEVVMLYRSEPAEIRVAGIFDQEKSARVRLVGTTEHGFELQGARARNGLFTIPEFTEVSPGIYELVIVVGPAAKPESTREPLDMQIGLKDGRTIEVGQWVFIDHLDPIVVEPAVAVQFGNRLTDPLRTAGAPPVVQTVTLRSRDPARRFQVLAVRLQGVPEGAFSTEIVPVEDGTRIDVKISLLAYREEPYLMGKVVIETDSPIEPIRTLHLRANFGKK